MKKKVSICVPCYNGADYLEHFFSSILNQTYSKLQIIFIDDGSNDGTRQTALGKEKEFVKKGMEFLYLYQEHHGQASAINTGLPHVDGEYFMWIDCDDFLESNHVEKKVKYLEEHSHVDVVMCRGSIYNECDLLHPIGTLGEQESVGTLFEDILFAYRACSCGLYMIRTQALFQAIPQKRIYDSQVGQNMQLLLPVTIRNHNGYISDKLYNFVKHKSSHSHSIKGGIQWKQRMDYLEDMKRHMLYEIPMKDTYREHLLSILDFQMTDMRIRYIDEQIENQNELYVKKVCEQYIEYTKIRQKTNGRKVYFWGAYELTSKISKLLETYMDIKTEGIIESNPEKVGKLWNGLSIISREEINKEKMYLIIPLNYHQELPDFLHSKEFEKEKDYFYPQYEIRRAVKDWKNDSI